MMFLFNSVIFRFQSLIFRGVSFHLKKFTTDPWGLVMPLALSSQSFPLSTSHAWRTAASSMSYSTATCTPAGHPKWSKFRPCTVFFVVFFGRKMGHFMVFWGYVLDRFWWATKKKRPSGSKLPMWRLRWKVEKKIKASGLWMEFGVVDDQ